MKTQKIFGLITILALLIVGLPVSGTVQADTLYTTITYDDITLPTAFQSFEMPDTWDMNQGPVVVTYTLDLSNAPNVAFDQNWNLMGLIGLFDATNQSGARMAGFLADWGFSQFPAYPDNNASYDTDDKFNLQRFPSPGSYDETMYNVKCDTNEVVSALGSQNNYGIWFDRDGVDQWQDDMWGMVNGGTYNTNGLYGVQLAFQKNSASLGTVCPLMFPDLVNPWVTSGYGIPTGFYTAWKPTGPDIIPAGLSFASDETKMSKMHVVVQGASGLGTIIIRDLTVTGYLNVDLETPLTSNVLATPNPAALGSAVVVTANVDDSTTGGSNIASASYEIFDSTNVSVKSGSMSAGGSFDSPTEDVTANITAPSMPGVYTLCVRGTDVPGNVGTPECTMFVVYDPTGGFVTGGGWIDSPAGAMGPTVMYLNGFETDIESWVTPTRVTSGTNGITSASGSYHAEAIAGNFTRWGGYNSIFPAGGFLTSIDVYLDMNAGFANDTRFDWSSAISNPTGAHRRDFVFSGGFYNDTTGPGAGLNRFVFSTSNNTPGWPKNPGRDPFAVATTGWYTLQHRFYDNGAGVLAVDLSILDSAGNLLHTWTLSDPSDVIGTTVGGNRYGWFATNNFPFLAIDNAERKEISTVTGKATFGFVSKYKKGASVPDGNTEFQFKAGDLNFSSTSYQWLVVNQGGTNAQFKGFGTINGTGDYGFMLWATDGSPDKFRIKIWDVASEVVVYDNGTDQAIGGGSIVVHKK